MTTTSPLEHISESAQALRRRLDTALQEMTSVGTRMGLPSAPESFEATRQRMQENAYTVLVMGEAKRGKSTLVNALMGQDLLPTDVDISTNQVFHVRWAEQPKFRLRFEDNSTKDIRASDLMLYGSQTVESPVGERIRTQSALRWIEVEGPFPFIASNIQILDSPGLGSLHAEHGRITRRFVPLSDAVLFVLSSSAPIDKAEIEAIQEILRYTRHIFFVQTQIDLHTEEHWQEILRRNREILEERFIGKIGNPKEPIRVWPVSGKELLLASRAPVQYRERHLAASHFTKGWNAFRYFLFQATGCERIAQAIEMGSQYYLMGKRYQSEEIRSLQDAGSEKRTELQERRRQELESFSHEWGITGTKRKDLDSEVRQIVRVGRQQFLSPLLPGGRLERYFSDRIDRVETVAEAKELADHISTRLPEYVAGHWLRCAQLCRAGLMQILIPALGETQAWDVRELQGELPTLESALRFDREVVRVKDDPLNRFVTAWRGAGMFLGLGALLTVVPGAGIVGLVLGPTVASGMAVKNLLESEKHLSEQTQPYLRNHLARVLTLIRNAYTETTLEGEVGLVDRFFGDTERGVLERIQDLVDRRKQELQQRLKVMDDAAQEDIDSLRRKVEILQQRQVQWNNFASRLSEFQRELTDIYNQPMPDVTFPIGEAIARSISPTRLENPTVRASTPEGIYREYLQQLKAKGDLSDDDYDKLDELRNRLNLRYATVKRIEREEGI